jgi:hypothetical protein
MQTLPRHVRRTAGTVAQRGGSAAESPGRLRVSLPVLVQGTNTRTYTILTLLFYDTFLTSVL